MAVTPPMRGRPHVTGGVVANFKENGATPLSQSPLAMGVDPSVRLPRKKLFSYGRMEKLQGFTFVLPWVIGFLVFTLFPLVFSLYTSFTNYNITSTMDWTGLQNYKSMFNVDPLFLQSVYNTLYYVVLNVPLNTVIAILVAVAMNQKVFGMRFFRTVYYLPHVVSGVAIMLLWQEMLNPANGLVNQALQLLGIPGPSWLTDPNWTKPALILMNLWGVGGGMLLYLNALNSVPEALYEAAQIDGASVFRRFWHVTVPMITPIIFFEMLTGLIGAFQVFQSAYVMSGANGQQMGQGGPLNSLMFYNVHMYNEAFTQFNVGYANAMAWFLFVVVMIVTLINMLVSRYWVHYEGGER